MASHSQALHLFDRSNIANSLNQTHNQQPFNNFPYLTVLLTSCLNSVRNIDKHPEIAFRHWSRKNGRLKDDDRSVADELAKKVRVLCIVMTQPSDHYDKARHIKATWGQRCNKLLFMSSKQDPSLPTIDLRVANGIDFVWEQTKEALRYVHQEHREDADWFLKTDTKSYVVLENLRYMLSGHNSTVPMSFGCHFESLEEEWYGINIQLDGVGHVLSKGALDTFVSKGLSSPLCRAGKNITEEETMDICLKEIGVRAMDSRDSFGRNRFLPFIPRDTFFPTTVTNQNNWDRKFNYYPTDESLGRFSELAVSFYNVQPQDMYLMDYFIYNLRAYGKRTIWRQNQEGNLTNTQDAQ